MAALDELSEEDRKQQELDEEDAERQQREDNANLHAILMAGFISTL